ncbi:MAG: efflux RND transporter periplasmic adaptor subunit, partial [Gammaproteobacteria bacterium]|nr:efflux RND transporter periplasmic adaptor subunit [Gammaproteobacteria bacterium]
LVIAATTVFKNIHLLKLDLPVLWSSWNIIQHLLFSMVTVNLLSQLSMGVVAKGYGVPDLKFGIRLVFGIVPRFNLRIDDLSVLARRELLWVHATPMLLRLTTLSIGAIGWLMMRASGTLLSTFLLVMAIVSLISFLFTANPLATSNGYAFLATLLNMPNLRQKAYRALLGRLFRARRTPDSQDEEHRFALRAYAVASILFLVALLGTVLILAARWLELNYQGTGVAIFVALVVLLGWKFRRQIKQRRESRRASPAGVSTGRSLTPATGVVPIHSGSPFPVVDIPAPPRRRRIRWVRVLVLGVLIACLFLPYPYETGGPATILSVQQREIHTETTGVLEEVFFSGGEWVAEGALIGRLSTHEQRKNIALTRAEIAEQEAKLEQLLTTPRKEEVEVAMKQLDSARVRAKFSAANAQRYQELYKSKSVSLDDLEEALKRAEVDRTEVVEKEAELELIKSGVHPKEIEAARSELDALKENLRYHLDQLERTNLVAPFSGQLVTNDLEQMVGQYFERGDLFVITQNSLSLRVEILVPESDIGDISEGALTRLKIWTYPDQIFEGRVAEIAPVVNSTDYGKVIRVVSEVPNSKKLLKSGMTGFGKVDGGTKPVYEAFTRMLVRFVLIEAWSWFP